MVTANGEGLELAAALLEHAADATWAASSDGTILWITPAPLRRYGLTPEQVVGTAVLDWVHPEDAPAFRALWQRIVTRDSAHEVTECRLAAPGLPDVWVRKRLTDLRGDARVRAICCNVVDITDTRRAEQDRRLQETRLQASFDQSGVPQVVLAPDGRFRDVNPAFSRLIAVPREDLIGMLVAAVTHATDSGAGDRTLARLAAGDIDVAQVERVVNGPGGRPVPVLVDATALRDREGNVDGVAGFLHDLSPLRSAEQRQQQQQDFFLALSRNASDLAVVVDAQYRILYTSSALSRVLGYDAAQVIGADGLGFVHVDDVAAARAAFEQVVTAGGTAVFVGRVRAADSRWRWMEGTATNLIDTPIGGIVSNLHDVTDRVEVERELAVAQKRYQDVFTTTSLGILLISIEGEVLEVNAALCRLTGYSRDELLSMKAEDLFASASMTLEQRQARVRAQGATGYEVEEVLLCNDDRELPVLVTVNLIEEPGGGSAQVSLVVRDQSRLKELQAQVLHGERREAAERVAAGVAHDTNNILAAVAGYAEMLGVAVAGQPDAERHLAGIRRSIERAGDMVTQLLASTRGQQLALARLDLREIVVDLEDMLRRLLPETVRFTLDAQPAPALADGSQVRQVVLNLVVNARDAVRGDGDVHLSTTLQEVLHDDVLPPATYAVVAVRDDGVGMPESVARRCFEPFFTTRVAVGGSGLGLSTAHGIARQSGGDLRVRTAPGRGATFELFLPAATAPAGEPAARAGRPPDGACVLVAEDDDELRLLVVEALETAGYRVTAAADGPAALRAGVVPDLLLTDLEMPGMDGEELSTALRERKDGIPVLFVSGRAVAPQPPGSRFLRKPFTMDALLDVVRALLRDAPA